MGYAVEMFVRDSESHPIRELFVASGSVLAKIGTSPHVSLAVFQEVDVNKLTEIVERFAAETAQLTLRFSSLGIFPGTQNAVFLAPVVTTGLLHLHEALHNHLSEAGVSSDTRYQPGSWVPHCAITVEEALERSLKTLRLAHDCNLLGEYAIEQIGIVRYRPVERVKTFKLTG